MALVAHEASRMPGDYDFVRFESSSGLQFVPKFRSAWFLHKGRLINIRCNDKTTCDHQLNLAQPPPSTGCICSS